MIEQSASSHEITLEEMRTVLEFSPVPTCILQWEKILYINPAGIALLGREHAEQTIYRYILQFDGTEEARRHRIERLRDRGDQVPIARRSWTRSAGKWSRQSGGTILLAVKAWAIPLSGGNGTQVTFADITQIHQQHQTREQREQYLRLAIDSSETGVWDLDPLTGKIRCSKRSHEIFNLPWNREMDYPTFLKLLHREDRARTHAAIQQSLRADCAGEFGSDYRIPCPDGKVRWVAAKGHAFFSNTEGTRKATRLIGTVLDITELRQSDASLRQNEKLAVTGRLAASIAHEINNPLEAITNLLYLLEDGSLNAEQRKYIELAQQELARVVDISIQALRFYRDPSAPAACNMSEIIDSALMLFNGRIAAMQIQVEREDCKTMTVLGAREELRQMLVNLIHNAMDAMPQGGRLLIRTKGAVNWKSGRKGVCLVVADTGHGMSRSTMKHIFEPFFTTRSSIGTGLGLWLCAGIVQKHRGTIKVRSCQRAGRRGTVFSIFLPLDRRQ
ncbi:MAG: ATP-binding protein [Acidobacteriaceae bacterium]